MKSPAKLTKLELARLKERFQGSNPTRHFNVRLEKAWRGRVILSMPVQGRHKQILKTVHGGVLALLVDTAGGLAAFLASPMDARVVTIEMKINFMEAVERGVDDRAPQALTAAPRRFVFDDRPGARDRDPPRRHHGSRVGYPTGSCDGGIRQVRLAR